jgi:hypothetical protein
VRHRSRGPGPCCRPDYQLLSVGTPRQPGVGAYRGQVAPRAPHRPAPSIGRAVHVPGLAYRRPSSRRRRTIGLRLAENVTLDSGSGLQPPLHIGYLAGQELSSEDTGLGPYLHPPHHLGFSFFFFARDAELLDGWQDGLVETEGAVTHWPARHRVSTAWHPEGACEEPGCRIRPPRARLRPPPTWP